MADAITRQLEVAELVLTGIDEVIPCMSRFRLPARVAPSPAAEEPGSQNSAARLRSSREVQSRILPNGGRRSRRKCRRRQGPASDMTTEHLADPEFAGRGKGESSVVVPRFAARMPLAGWRSPGKRSWLSRLPLAAEKQLEQIPARAT